MTTADVAAPVARAAATPVSTFVAPVRPMRHAGLPQANAPCPCGSGRKAKKCCGLAGGAERPPQAPEPPAVSCTDARIPADPDAEADDSAEAFLGAETRAAGTAEPGGTQCVTADQGTMPAASAEPADSDSALLEALQPLRPLCAEGAGCAAWMRLTGLYPWKPLSMAERRAGLERLTRYTRHWMRARMDGGAFRSLTQPLPGGASAGGGVSEADGAMEEGMEEGMPEGMADPAGGAYDEGPDHAHPAVRAHAEPSFELAEELEISEAKLNQFLREHAGLSAREWWDAVRAPAALTAIRAEIEAALDGTVLDRTAQIRRRGVQAMDLHRALRRNRRALGRCASGRAWNLGYKSAARLNLALWRATGLSMQELEARILLEIYETWSFDHRTCRLCAKIRGGADRNMGAEVPNVPNVPIVPNDPVGSIDPPLREAPRGAAAVWRDGFGPEVRIA
ncbi:MAG: SEC-C domain-containing protein [Planctomycetota bacterium]|nr:SEC-C domain-containing protein [Planctomycetota bacterium]